MNTEKIFLGVALLFAIAAIAALSGLGKPVPGILEWVAIGSGSALGALGVPSRTNLSTQGQTTVNVGAGGATPEAEEKQ